MTDQNTPQVTLLKIFIGAICGGITSYGLTQLSLHGVDFTTLGVNSEIVKGAITTTVSGYVMAPILIIYKIRDLILWFWQAKRIIADALQGKKSYETPNQKDMP
jgi:hypothetical protein